MALVALLVGCSSGSGPASDGGGGVGGKVGGAGGGGGHGGAAGATATGGTVGSTGGGGGAAGATAGTGGVGGAAGGAAGAIADGGGVDAVDAGTHPTDGGCQGVDLSGVGVPTGTVATASNSLDSSNAPGNAIDGDLGVQWGSGTNTGWLKLTFPAPTMVSAIRIHASALPVTSEMYSVSTSTSTVPLGGGTFEVPEWPGGVLPDIQVTPGLYSDLTITVNGGASWVGINELWLLAAPACP